MAERPTSQSPLSLVLAIAGTTALALSFTWPALDDGRSAWTDEKAQRYSEVAQQMHTLGFRDPARPGEDPESVEAEFQQLEAELQWAQNRGGRISRWFGVAAIVLIGAAWGLGRKKSPGGLGSSGQR